MADREVAAGWEEALPGGAMQQRFAHDRRSCPVSVSKIYVWAGVRVMEWPGGREGFVGLL